MNPEIPQMTAWSSLQTTMQGEEIGVKPGGLAEENENGIWEIKLLAYLKQSSLEKDLQRGCF